MTSVPMLNRPTRWSFSSLSTFEQCKKQYKLWYIDRLRVKNKGDESPAASRGTKLHGLIEKYLTTPGSELSLEVRSCHRKNGEYFAKIKAKGAAAEEAWAIDKDWNILPPDIDRDDPLVWFYGVIDGHWEEDGKTLYIRDWKSGRLYPDHSDQFEIYALIGLCKFPHIKRVDVAGFYIDQGYEAMEASYIRAMLPVLRQRWEGKARQIFTEEEFPANPSLFNCRYCEYGKEGCENSALKTG